MTSPVVPQDPALVEWPPLAAGGSEGQPVHGARRALDTLAAWRASGLVRALDLALARQLVEADPGMPATLVLAAALVAQAEGSGHACLDLAWLAADPVGCTGWPESEGARLREALQALPASADQARAAWQERSSLAHARDAGQDAPAPLVLDGHRLYLSRLWGCERRVAAQVFQRASRMRPADGELEDVAVLRGWLSALFSEDRPAPPALDSGGPSSATGTGGPAGAEQDGQRLACALVLRSGWTVLTGGPGTGKTYTAARMLAMLWAAHPGPQPLRVGLAAPTGKAAARLRQAIERTLLSLRARLPRVVRGSGQDAQVPESLPSGFGPALTLHKLLGARPGTRRFAHDAQHPLDLDVLLVDEASMVHLELMDALLEALPPNTRVVLLGDRDQLASVEAGSVLADLCAGAEGVGWPLQSVEWVRSISGQALPIAAGPVAAHRQQTVTLSRTHRFAGGIGALAAAVNRGDAAASIELLSRAGQDAGGDPQRDIAAISGRLDHAVASLAADGRPGAPGGYGDYLSWMGSPRPELRREDFAAWVAQLLERFDRFRVLCALREGPQGVQGLNLAIERELARRGWLPSTRGAWYEGRPVMVTRNEAALGLFNGDIGVVLHTPGVAGRDGRSSSGGLRAWFPGVDGPHSVSVNRLTDVETAFAMTVHKSQGSEFGHVALVLPERDNAVLSRELLYTGITRARQALTVCAGEPSVWLAAVARRTRRASGLADRLAGPEGGLGSG